MSAESLSKGFIFYFIYFLQMMSETFSARFLRAKTLKAAKKIKMQFMIIMNRALLSLKVISTVIFGLFCSHISCCLMNFWQANSKLSPHTDFATDSNWSRKFISISPRISQRTKSKLLGFEGTSVWALHKVYCYTTDNGPFYQLHFFFFFTRNNGTAPTVCLEHKNTDG